MDPSMSASVSASAQLNGIDSLVAPIALYPDPLVGIILPAATAPNDLAAAAQAGGQATGSWDPAVQDLAHYPELVQWMASNQDWSAQLGATFANDPGKVMDSIQDLRHRAVDAGTLKSNAQIEVFTDGNEIRILPRDANVVYIPQYDPNAVFVRGHAGVEITFGTGLPAGDWLAFYPVWRNHAVYAGDWYAYSRGHGGWHFDVAVSSGFFHHGGINGVKGSHEYKVAGNAQIRQEQFRSKADVHGNYAHPAAFGARGSAQVGFQANRSGDMNRDRARTEEQNRSAQTFQGDSRHNDATLRDQQAKSSADQAKATEQARVSAQAKADQDRTAAAQRERTDANSNRATFQGDSQRNEQQQRDQQAKASEPAKASEQAKSEQNKSAEAQRQQADKDKNRATFQGDQPRLQDEQGQNRADENRQYQQNQAKAEQNRNDVQSQPDQNMNRNQTDAQKQDAYKDRSAMQSDQNRQENSQANKESTDINQNKYQQRSTNSEQSKDSDKGTNRDRDRSPSSNDTTPSSQ